MSGRMTLHDAETAAEPSARPARPCRLRHGRWLAGPLQRCPPLRPDAAGGRRGRCHAQATSRAWARSRWTTHSPARCWRHGLPAARRRSRRRCSTRRRWSASATSMPARRCSWPASRRGARRTRSRASAPTAWSTRSSTCCSRSIEDGGSTLRDHVQPGGELGYFQTRFNVYDRAGIACPTRDCGKTVRRLVQAGRSTFYCTRCQR